MNDQTQPVQGMDAEALISKYLDIRNYLAKKDDEFKAFVAPYKQAMETIEGALAIMARATNQKSISAPSGTAFPIPQMSVKCEDRDAYLNFVFSTGAKQFLTANVSKDALKDYMENNEGAIPPGIKVENFIKWQVRKS